MDDFFRDGIWQFIGAALGFIAIIITIAIYYAQRGSKRLAYEIISKAPVISAADEVVDKIQIMFDGKQVKKVHLLIVKLTNIGNIPITKNDYERELSINFNEQVQILTKDISPTTPENLKAEIEIINNSIVLKPTLLNSGDNITINCLLSDFDDHIIVDGRIVGVKTIEKKIEPSGVFGSIYLLLSITVFIISTIYSLSGNPLIGSVLLIIGIVLSVFTIRYLSRMIKN